MESYLWKSGLSLVMLYALYSVMLRYELDHQLNRFIGLTCILFSIVVPFAAFSYVSQTGPLPGVFTVVTGTAADFQETVSAALPQSTLDIVWMVYVIGAAVCLFRSVFGLAKLLMLYLHSPRWRRWGFTVVGLHRPVSPFTFFNVLFMGKDHMNDAEQEVMLLHERVHRDQYHSVDNLFLEIAAVVFWFNPAIWLFKRDIKAAHEYYADERVLDNGISPEEYQHMLFKARTGISIEFGNYLSNKTSLIKRFHMMTSARSKPKGSYWRVSLYVVLMSTIVSLSAFRSNDPQPDKVATYDGGAQAMFQVISKQIRYPATARKENRSGLVMVTFTVTEQGDVEHIKAGRRKEGHLLNEMVVTGYSQTSEEPREVDDTLKAEAVRAVESLGKFIPAQKDGKPVRSVLTLPIKFTLEK